MIKNIGTPDRIMRLVLGIICFIGAFFSQNNLTQIILILVGLFCVFQATFSWCAFYTLIGKNTCPIQNK